MSKGWPPRVANWPRKDRSEPPNRSAMTIDGASPRSVGEVAEVLTIRPATLSDAEAAIRLIERVYGEYGFIFVAADETPDLLDFDRIYDGKQAAFFVAIHNGKLV